MSNEDELESHLTTDQVVRLFQAQSKLKAIPGESNVAVLSRVEDMKAHPGQFGQGHVTNIRFIWYIQNTPTINASIGYNTIVSYKISNTFNQSNGNTENLFIRAKEGTKTYEFIFSVSRISSSVFKFFEKALKNYQTSTLYREQRLRSAIINNGSLNLIQNEQVVVQMDGVSNFSGEMAKIGTAIVTTMRFVWHSEIVSNFNVSIPLILLGPLKLSDSRRFGKCFYLKLYSNGARFLYGFTLKPEDKLIEFLKSFEKIRQSAAEHPKLTPPLSIEVVDQKQEVPVNQYVEEEFHYDDIDQSLFYIPIEQSGEAPAQEIVFDKRLGLSIEKITNGDSITSKWTDASQTPISTVEEL